MELCKIVGKTVWPIDKHAQIGMGFIRKNRQLIFGKVRNQERNRKKVHDILRLHI